MGAYKWIPVRSLIDVTGYCARCGSGINLISKPEGKASLCPVCVLAMQDMVRRREARQDGMRI